MCFWIRRRWSLKGWWREWERKVGEGKGIERWLRRLWKGFSLLIGGWLSAWKERKYNHNDPLLPIVLVYTLCFICSDIIIDSIFLTYFPYLTLHYNNTNSSMPTSFFFPLLLFSLFLISSLSTTTPPSSGCAIYSSSSRCSHCLQSYYLIPSNYTCQPCPSSCLTCVSNTVCT